MKWSDFERFLKPHHLNGRRVVVKITRVAMEETHPRPGQTVKAPVLYFEGKSKGLILSPTNCRTIGRLFGDDANACIGQTVILQAVDVKVGGETRHPIRIFPADPLASARPEAQQSAAVN